MNYTNSLLLLLPYPERRLDGFMVESLHWIQAYLIISVTDVLCSLDKQSLYSSDGKMRLTHLKLIRIF